MNVLFLSAALDEHLAQVDFYDRCRAGLGTEYLAEASAAVKRIADAPASFPAMNPPVYRRCVMRRFPFNIIFRQQGEVVVIVAIAAQRRAPDYWLHR